MCFSSIRLNNIVARTILDIMFVVQPACSVAIAIRLKTIKKNQPSDIIVVFRSVACTVIFCAEILSTEIIELKRTAVKFRLLNRSPLCACRRLMVMHIYYYYQFKLHHYIIYYNIHNINNNNMFGEQIVTESTSELLRSDGKAVGA